LQKVYSDPMKAEFTDENNKQETFWMGTYGIGVSRMVQAIVEQNYDDKGIIWPKALAPYEVVVVPAGKKMLDEAKKIYNKLSESLGANNIILDDRGKNFGEAISDAELIGYPVQVVVGRSWSNDEKLEVKYRDGREGGDMVIGELVESLG
jgi:prolyl-tRNA synthetase